MMCGSFEGDKKKYITANKTINYGDLVKLFFVNFNDEIFQNMAKDKGKKWEQEILSEVEKTVFEECINSDPDIEKIEKIREMRMTDDDAKELFNFKNS